MKLQFVLMNCWQISCRPSYSELLGYPALHSRFSTIVSLLTVDKRQDKTQDARPNRSHTTHHQDVKIAQTPWSLNFCSTFIGCSSKYDTNWTTSSFQIPKAFDHSMEMVIQLMFTCGITPEDLIVYFLLDRCIKALALFSCYNCNTWPVRACPLCVGL